jgi:hypothetical protein
LPATTFSYQNGSSGFGSEINTGHTAPATPAWWIDVNGDGRRDAVYSSSTGAGTWMVMFANSSGGFSSPINTGHPNTNYAGATPIDYNADGLEDILVPYTGGTWWVLLGTTSGLAAHSNTSAPVTATGSGANARAIDMDGDGYQDLVWADLVGYAGGDAVRYRLRVPGQAFSSTVYTAVGPLPADQKFTAVFGHTSLGSIHRIPDFNGDGRGDIVWQQVIPDLERGHVAVHLQRRRVVHWRMEHGLPDRQRERCRAFRGFQWRPPGRSSLLHDDRDDLQSALQPGDQFRQ